MSHLLHIISSCENLKTIRAYGNESTDTGLKEFPQIVADKNISSNLENLDFHWVTTGNNGFQFMCKSFDSGFFTNIKILDLSGINIIFL